MHTCIPVQYQGKISYEIYLTEDFSLLSKLLGQLYPQGLHRVCIVSDSHVAPLYEESVRQALEALQAQVTSFVFPAGEEQKHLGTVEQLYAHLMEAQLDRKDLLIALGGGVVGDLTGFAAATYLRGIDFIQIPTTLLSQVDSSIGGKTGVDFLQYKNMVGAFYMPKLVYMNLAVLETLPEKQFVAGMGEILKHGFIKDASYHQWIKDNAWKIRKKDREALFSLIAGSCNIKREVVEKDPKEAGERAFLNFGHTIGHAIEKLSDFQLLHGEGVALGMVAAAYLSHRYGSLKKEALEEIITLLRDFHLPVQLEGYSFTPEEILQATKSDKKMQAGRIRFVFLKEIGTAYLEDGLSDEMLLEGISYLMPDRAQM